MLIVYLGLLIRGLKLLREAHLAWVEGGRLRTAINNFINRIISILVQTDAHLSGVESPHRLYVDWRLSLRGRKVV